MFGECFKLEKLTISMSSNNYILSEENGEHFKAEDILSINQDKFRINKIKCEETELGILLVNYFRDKVINTNNDLNTNDFIKKEIIVKL